MADWTDQSVSSLLPGEPWTSAKAIASFENPVAIAEGAVNAPVMVTGWHPYNKVTVGDSNDGLFYDHAVDGTVASVETPVFELGYEYAVRFEGLSSSGGLSTNGIEVRGRRRSDGTYENWIDLTAENAATGDVFTAILLFRFPGIPSRRGKVHTVYSELGSGPTGILDPILFSTPQALQQLEFRYRDGGQARNIDAGKMYLWRRREYITG